MNYLLIVFHSRNEALNVRNYLQKNGVSSTAINAPRILSVSCGLALKIVGVQLSMLTNLLSAYPNRFGGVVYSAVQENGSLRYKRLIN